jgi:predicted glutamine amidotransferase
MCGLVGMAGFLEHNHKKAMMDLFFLNTLRGKDSTGLSAVARDRGILTRKMTVPGYEFIEYPVVERAMKFADQLWLGHGRYKTHGDVSRQNAHPFEVLDDEGDVLLIGAHNGTLNNKYEIERLLGGDKYETDSEALFNWLVEADDYKKAIAELRGAWSLVWWDPTTNTVNFCRNNERPMTYAFTKDKKVMIWASEAWMIINACRRNNVELLQNDKGLSCYSTNVDTLYTLDIPQERNKELPELRREVGYAGAPARTFCSEANRRWNSWWDSENWDPNDPNNPNSEQEREKKPTQGTQKTTTVAAKNGGAEVITLGRPSVLKGYNGESITAEELKKIVDAGCGWCGDPMEDRLFGFLNEESVVCSRCMRDAHPKGECLRREEDDDLDDDLPFELSPKGKEIQQRDSSEYRSLIRASAESAKAVG